MTDKVKLIRDCFDAFARGDAAFIVARVSDDVDWRHSPSPEIPYAGAYKGPQGVGQFFTRIGEALDVTSWEPRRVIEAGEDVLATGAWSAKAKPTGRSFAAEWAMVFGFRDGRISSFKVYEDTAVVAAAFRH
ncbi:MAG: nuclear transport factor 2 family protein [Reyranella sp.]|nr:nuclear transport factor 2 family protein [Reyranella sp.]